MRSQYRAGGSFDKAISDLIQARGGEENSFLVQEMITTALKLVDEKASRGDLKVVNTALKELRYAFKIFTPYRHIKKVSVFGSARAHKHSNEYKAAQLFAKRAVEKGFMVITGAASGVMEAANAGAGPGKSFGINIRLPHEQEANPYIREDRNLINFKYFFTRKLVFIKESNAVVLFPGGYGTHDECFEILTLIQTGKSQPMPVVMMDNPAEPYWSDWLRFVERQLLSRGYISPEDMAFFKIVDTAEAAVEEILHFYRNYHSARYVKDLFVMRVHRAPKKMMANLNQRFRDVIGPKGKFEAARFLPEEELEEGVDLALPRIAFPFKRTSFGRIRQIIDCINEF